MADEEPRKLLTLLESYEKSLARDGPPQDPLLRAKLQQSAQRLSRSLENSYECTSRILCQDPVECSLVRLGVDMGIYEALASSTSPVSFAYLQQITGAEKSLLARILDGLSAFKSIVEIANEGYILPSSSKYLSEPGFAKDFLRCIDFLHPTIAALPQKLASEAYKSPETDVTDLAVQLAHGEKGKTMFEMFASRPEVGASFAQLMSTWGLHGSLLHEVYPIERLEQGFNASISDIMLVDLGGSWGQKSIALKEAHPNLPGRIIVQDLPQVIASAPESALVEFQVHDFFTPQPVKGARTYYIRQTLHNWSDEDAIKVLTNIKDAMTPGYSKLLVHELVLAKPRPDIWPVTQDFIMMTLLGTSERTREGWERVIVQAELQVVDVFSSEDPASESVIEAVRV